MSDWTFITNHAAVLISIHQNKMITTRDLAIELGITERSVIRIIKDLETDGYIIKERKGRANQYQTKRNLTLRKETFRDVEVGELLDVLAPNENI